MRHEITPLFGKKKVILRETARAVTPYGGLCVFVEFLRRLGWAAEARRHMPIQLTSPNAIDPVETLTAFLVAVVAGARRFAHTALLRGDRALHALVGLRRYPGDDTIRNLFKRFGMGQVEALYGGLTRWVLSRVPARKEGYSLDLDSTIFERYGRQEGATRGYNPRKPGRNSHHPLLGVLAESCTVVHSWLRSGNCGAARGVVAFLEEALALLPAGLTIRTVRGDSGFFEEALLGFLERRALPYIVVARMTRWLRREVEAVRQWQELDAWYAAGEFELRLLGWPASRRCVVLREQVRETKPAVGRKLVDVPGYTFRLFVTNRPDPPAEIWRDYNQRATLENRIAGLKYDLAADDFCLRWFFATEAAFRAVILVFNLLAEFQRAAGLADYRRPATLRSLVFVAGGILGRTGQRTVLFLSRSWGGLEQRISLFNKMLEYDFPTSPKLVPESPT